MRRRANHALVVAVLAATGCASPTSRFYTLDAVAGADGGPPARYSVAVGPVTIPAAVDRPQIVVQAGPNRVVMDEFNRWAGPLDEGIASVVAQDLASLLGTPHVVVGTVPGVDPAYRVRIDVQRFESTPDKDVLVDAAWTVYVAGGSPRSGRTVAREPVAGEHVDALAAAHSRALGTVSADVAKAIRDDAGRSAARRDKGR